MTHLAEHCAGVCLGGEYTLERYLKTSGDGSVWFEGARGSEKVLLKVTADEEAGQRLDLWRRTAHLQHPNLLRLLGCGRDETAAGESCVYAAFEWPDDSLASAPAPLSEDDARELLTACLDALRYLHAQGLVHGSVDAAHVLAAGNTIKLSADDLHEPDAERFTYAADVGALGALLHWVLTGTEYNGAPAGIAEPFASIVRNTAGVDPADRWRIPEIVVAAKPPAPPVEELPAQQPPRVEPPPAPESSAPPGPPPSSVQPAAPRIPVWAWPLSVAAIAACFAWVFHTPGPKAAPPPMAPASAPAPAVVAPRPTAPDPAPPAESAAAQPPQTGERVVWRVIAYTYNALRDAKKKALAINKRWPGLNAEVFSPKGVDHPPYLVALGGRMNRIEAARVLQKARTRGLPRDTFMLNFSD